MASTTENINRVLTIRIPMTRFSISEEEEEEDDDRLASNTRRLSSQSQRTVQRSQSSATEVESDSQGSEEMEVDDDDDGEEVELIETAGSDDDSGDDDDSSDHGEAEVEVANRTVSTTSPVDNDANGELQVVLSDPSVLDCPICFQSLCTPVFQCDNGHVACSSCCSKVNRKCPSCSMPIGYNRCRAIEKVIESIKISCKNAQHGCKETMTYSKKDEHEHTCPHAECFCPYPSCLFVGSSQNTYLHFRNQHKDSTTHFTYNTPFSVPLKLPYYQLFHFLQEQHESVIFVLNKLYKFPDWVFGIGCVGPSTFKTCFEYQITAKSKESTLSLQGVPKVCTKWSEQSQEMLKNNYLMVPSDFFGRNETASLQICIKKALPPAV